MDDKDDSLGLSLSLGCAQNQPSLKLNLMPLALPCMQNLQQRNIWSELFQSSDGQLETRSVAGGIDVNQAPALTECEEEDGVSSPNSTVSSIGGKRNGRDPVCHETEAERPSCSRTSDDEDGVGAGDDASRKKLRLSKEQSLVLEETFKEHSTLNPKHKLALAMQLNLRPRQVEVWFQNRRARTKLKQTEVDCEYLKRCCDNLTEENRRLQKEVQELRALKLSPQLYTHINPPTTLTMCPSCERVAVASSSSLSLPASSALSRIFNTKDNILMGLGWIFKRKKKQNSTSNTPTSTASPSTRSSSQTQLQELEQIFNKLDVNGDGKISLSELGSIMGSLAQKHQSKEELQKMMKEFNADYGDGFMNFDQFVELNTNGVESEEVLKDAFSVYDRNGNGWISAEELQEVLKSLGDECSIEECRKMISGVDNDGNGMIDFQEFKVMMVAAHSIQPLNGLNL